MPGSTIKLIHTSHPCLIVEYLRCFTLGEEMAVPPVRSCFVRWNKELISKDVKIALMIQSIS